MPYHEAGVDPWRAKQAEAGQSSLQYLGVSLAVDIENVEVKGADQERLRVETH